jgi:DGQHR domain-containing protein
VATLIDHEPGGDIVTKVKAIVFKQKGASLFLFTMNATELEPLCFVEAATRDKSRGLQRVTEVSRLKEIAEYISSGMDAILPNNIIVNLTPQVAVDLDEDGQFATLTFPTAEGDYAFVVDGQHRLFSFQDEYRKLQNDEVFDLPVVALHNASQEQVGATFVSINVNQKPVNRDLLTQMKAILGLLDNDIDKATIELIHSLDEDAASPVKNRILRYPKERDKWIKVNQLQPVVNALLAPGGCLHDKTQAERKQILTAYLTGVKNSFPDAWADEKGKSYALLQASGLQLVIGLLPDLLNRCDFSEGFNYTAETFKRQLEPLAESTIVGGWKRSSVDDFLSTTGKRKLFMGQLKELLKVRPPTPQ